MRGCGFRCRQRLANAAFVSCMVEVAEVMVDRSTVDGRVEGYFQALLPTLGAGPSVFYLSVSVGPGAPKGVGGREKTKTKNRGGPGAQNPDPSA